jgi:hypothetical protein
MRRFLIQLIILFVLGVSSATGKTLPISGEDKDVNTNEPTCPPGKDTTYLICPHYDHFNNLLFSVGLPIDGIWEPPLQDSFGTIYNSCDDGTSIYIYQHDYPGCPTVTDTARFELLWDPCAWKLENVCYSEDSIFFTIPAFPGDHEASTYWFNWYFQGETFNLDSSYDLSVAGSPCYDLHIFLDESPFCWWTFGELLGWDFYGTCTDIACSGSEPPCPSGHDTTLVICPYQSFTNNFLVSVGLPSNGIWEPPLHSPFQEEYNSCFDSASAYIFTTSVPGCPDIQDTVHFDLLWNPPCDCAYEVCYTDVSFSITIPPIQEINGNNYVAWIAMAASDPWKWEICGDWILSPDTTHTLSCIPGWDNADYNTHCVDIAITDPASGCSWLISTLNTEYWDCNILPCEAVAVDEASAFTPVNVYPVPTDEILIIDMDNPITEVTLSGPDGQLYKTITNPVSNQINVADLGPGWYHLRIFDGQDWYQASMVK